MVDETAWRSRILVHHKMMLYGDDARINSSPENPINSVWVGVRRALLMMGIQAEMVAVLPSVFIPLVVCPWWNVRLIVIFTVIEVIIVICSLLPSSLCSTVVAIVPTRMLFLSLLRELPSRQLCAPIKFFRLNEVIYSFHHLGHRLRDLIKEAPS
ncbi:hypothetical protein Tco_0727703 [Tanacetum coccineum]|uniref:Uncharacterized protein n=1 Tax=Tanacetum coccineum TaxID=301880 RepID=A0ABQ4YJX4_9ASTR